VTETQFYAGKHLLITGGSGYLASNLLNLLSKVDCRITRLSRRSIRAAAMLGEASITDVQGDIRDRTIWEQILGKVDIVFHLAAQTSVNVAERDPIADLEINVLPVLCMLETCRKKSWHPILLFSGTVTECGIPTNLPVDENHPDQPITIYDMHKLMAENYLKHYIAEDVVRGAVLRLANVYGPGPRHSSADRGVLNSMIRKAMLGENLTVYGQGHHLTAPVYIERINGKHFVLGMGEGYTILEAINLVAERVAIKTGKRAPVVSVEPPNSLSPIERRNFIADTRQFTLATGWKAKIHLSEGIDRTIDYFSGYPGLL